MRHTRVDFPGGRGTSRQRGAAAIEFALVVTALLLLFAGIVSLGGMMWVQQTLVAAAAEGARAVLDSSQRGAVDTATGCSVANDAASWLNVQCSAQQQACTWRAAGGAATQCVVVALTYKTTDWPVLASMSGLATRLNVSSWVPDSLGAQAVVQIQEPS